MENSQLLDERTRPDFRELYGRLASRSGALDAAVARARLGGMNLGHRELGGVRRIRLLVGEMNALTVATEAESLALDPARRKRLILLVSLFGEGRLSVRLAPLGGWSPDFSIFSCPNDDMRGRLPTTLMIGQHWFERPYPHASPALGVVLTGAPAVRARERFHEVWDRGHDVRDPIEAVLTETLRKTTQHR